MVIRSMKEPKAVDDFENWHMPELMAAIGTTMRDLRGSWGDGSYDYRMRETLRMLNALKDHYEDLDAKDKFVMALDGSGVEFLAQINADIALTDAELMDPYDGRVFRGAYFYESNAKEGQTDRVRMYLYTTLSYPEYTWMEIDEDE